PGWVAGAPGCLTKGCNNLLDNAVKFRDGGSGVNVDLTVDPGNAQAVVTVVDDGIGIAPEVFPRLFEPFGQADRSLDRSRGGLGLGLSLVKGLIDLHGGQVEATSEGPGRGATFTVRLPLKTETAALAQVPPGPLAPAAVPLRI